MRFPDLTTVWRSLCRSPGYVVACVSMLALATASLTAIFSAVQAVVLDPLPVREPGRVVLAWESDPPRGVAVVEVSYRNYRDWQRSTRSLEQLAAMGSSNWVSTLDTGHDPVRLSFTAVSANFFEVLGARPALGRTFRPDDDTATAPGAIVLSHGGWVRHFGADPRVVGRLVSVDEARHEVVGVMPPDLEIPAGVDYWTPISPVLTGVSQAWKIDAFEMRGLGILYVMGRLRAGATPESAAADLGRIARGLPEASSLPAGVPRVVATRLLDFAIGPVRVVLLWLTALAGIVLAIACVNVSGLMLARATLRRGEDAVRLSLGASRGRLARLWWIEATLLAAPAVALGLLASTWLTRTLVLLAPPDIPRLDRVRVDADVALVSALIVLVAMSLCAVLPAFHTMRATTGDIARVSMRATTSRSVQRVRSVLVSFEVALAVVLLLATGLTVRSFMNLRRVDPGFDTHGVLTLEVEPLVEQSAARVFYRTFLERIRRLPGVRAAGGVFLKPLALGPIGSESGVLLEGQPADAWHRNPFVNYEVVTSGYFEAMGTRLVRGRFFSGTDDEHAPSVAIVGEATARTLWPGRNAVGQRVGIPHLSDKSGMQWRTVVGVVQDMRYRGLDDPRLDYYEPAFQATQNPKDIIVSTSYDNPVIIADAIEAQARAIAPRVLTGNVATLESILLRAQAPWRFTAWMFTAFGTLAFALAVGGLFSVVALWVAQRRREFALRAALGAEPRDVMAHVLGQAIWLASPGVVCGAAGAWLSGRWLRSLLFDVSALDAGVFLGVPTIVIAIMLLASWMPARRASRVEPGSLLRE